jgi:hypothetical protein
VTAQELYAACCQFLREKGYQHQSQLPCWDLDDRYYFGEAMEEALEDSGVDLREEG